MDVRVTDLFGLRHACVQLVQHLRILADRAVQVRPELDARVVIHSSDATAHHCNVTRNPEALGLSRERAVDSDLDCSGFVWVLLTSHVLDDLLRGQLLSGVVNSQLGQTKSV